MNDRPKPAYQEIGKTRVRRILSTASLMVGLWWIITHGTAESWLIGLPAVAGATWASSRLSRSLDTHISALGLARFIPFFLWESMRGGVDVAWRTLAPQMRISPGFTRFRTALRTPSARAFFVNCVSLLPGTLVADLQDEWLELHILTTRSDPNAELARLERVVAQLFPAPEETP